VTEGAYIGCSIAVNGTCLTATAFGDDWFTVNCAPETLRRTNLGALVKDSKVNLERAALSSGRNSGHAVQGHVDATGTVVNKKLDGEALWVTIQVPKEVIRFIVEKGYIAIDGTSLTVCTVDTEKCEFAVMLIAHTQKCIILPHKEDGDKVNIEVDVVSKYVEASVGPRLAKLEAAVFGKDAAASAAATAAAAPAAAWTPPADKGDAAPALTANEGATGENDGELVEIKKVLEHANQHGAGLAVEMPTIEVANGLKIGIVKTCWHSDLINLLESNCIDSLVKGGVQKKNILRTKVSGSFELPYVCQRLIEKHDVDAVVAIGILLKGGTIHMEVIAHATTKALLDLQLKTSTPVIFGVLTVFSMDQARERAESDLGNSWGDAALSQAQWHKEDPADTAHLLQTAE